MIHKKYIWIVILLILSGLVIYALGHSGQDENNREVSLYFLEKSGYSISPVTTEISATNDAELFKKVAEALVKGPTDNKYAPIMDGDVKVNFVDFSEGMVTVDFSEEYPEENLMCTYAVIKTFSRLSGVVAVQVTENGAQIVGKDGIALGFLSNTDVNTESDEDTATGVRLYFANSKKDGLVMEYRKINIVDTKPIEQYVVTELIKGPKLKGNERLLAADTKVLSVETTDGICYVNFKKGFVEKNMASGDGGKLAIESVVKTLTDLGGIKSVQFLVDGKKTENSGETDISEQFEKEPVENQENIPEEENVTQ